MNKALAISVVEWQREKQRLRIRLTDREIDFRREHVIGGSRTAAAQFVDKECAEAISISAKREVDEINADRRERQLPVLTGNQKHKIRTACRERLIARKAKQLGEEVWADVVKNCNAGKHREVAEELIASLKQ